MVESGFAELGTVVTYNPWTVSDETPLSEMVCMLTAAEFHHWPVVDADQRLLGLVSETDILRALEEHATATTFRGAAAHGSMELPGCCVRDLMTPRPVTIDHRASLATVLRLLDQNDFQALPVMQEEELIGMVTSSDLLREFSYGEWPGGREAVSDILKPSADPIDWDASLDDAAMALKLSGADYVGVVRADFPLGVISDQDVRGAHWRATSRKCFGTTWELPGATSVQELVASAPNVRPGACLAEAATILVDHHRRAAAVINQAGRLLGAVTEDGILGRLTERLLG